MNTVALSRPEPVVSASDESLGEGPRLPGPAPAPAPAPLPALDGPEAAPLDLAGARGRRRWTFGAAIITGVAVAAAVTLSVVSARADETNHILALTSQIDSQVTTTSARSHDLAAVMDLGEQVYAYSDGQVADPATRDVLAQALADARRAAAQRVTDTPPTSVTQARTLLDQAAHIESSLDWATEDLRIAIDMVQQSQGAQRALDTREPMGGRTILTSHHG